MSSNYNRFSVYKNTEQSWFLGQYEPTPILDADDDIFMEIPNKYNESPAGLAKEMYGNERLWYIFTLANMDIIIDPIYDFKSGTTIRVPSNTRVQRLLGGTQ